MSEETQKKASNKNTQLTQPIKHGLEKGLHGGKKAIGIGIKFTNFVTNIPFIAHLIRAAERLLTEWETSLVRLSLTSHFYH